MIKDISKLKRIIDLKESEESFFKNKSHSSLEFGISDNIAGLLKNEAIRRQFIPQIEECYCDYFLDSDPLREVDNSSCERIIHRYKNRIAFLVTDKCFAYCRYCFRRRFTSQGLSNASDKDIEACASYIYKNPDITEILLTGGDALTLNDGYLEKIIKKIRAARSNIVIRLCSRALFSHPDRITRKLCSILKKYNKDAPVFFMTQFNTHLELCQKSVEKINMLRRSGIMLFNQSVLLKGVNDSAVEQIHLARLLLQNGIKPYYLFILDKVKGIEHFRVGLKEAIEIEKEMRCNLSGLEMPTLAVDLPESGGKVPINYNYLKSIKEDGSAIFENPDGRIVYY